MTLSKKVVILGHFGVGKTSLIRRFVENSFSENYQVSIGVHIMKKEVEVPESENVTLILWDLEGTDDIEKVRQSYLLGTHGLIYVFDVTRPTTFQNINSDIEALSAKLPGVPLQLIGNKIDLVDLNELKKLLKENKIKYDYLSSAKTGAQVNELFTDLAKALS
ncbi:GTP-binding protein [Leptobacterium flavescens]|uniref:GTP-binding protein n=1 Tax=Leptobacterium flavescens TaxID=472055 RepID=A0A6P0UI61_9FLAO|nr:Rab family GTPase [Leptobacterium flavescens]NER12934.1 GTP-binding protein [Leptobacterium flavescens]